jgi:membrane protease YdiL (CAAX protease family)
MTLVWPDHAARQGAKMETAIGQGLKLNRPSLWFTTAISAAVVGCDMFLVATGRLTSLELYGLPAVVIVSFGTVALNLRDKASFGFRMLPMQGWAYWAKVTVVLAAVFLIVLVACAAVFLGLLHYSIPPSHVYLSHRSQIWPLFVWMCVISPTTEEIIFRLAICPPVAAWFGPKATIAVNGVIFAALHVLYGNASPENLLAGFFLAWAFLKSGTLAVPMALHSLGNLCAFASQVLCFYWRL